MTDESLLAGLAEEFVAGIRSGKAPDQEEYAVRYPQLAGRIRELFPILMMLEGAAGAKESSASPQAGLSPGTIFGPYRIVREIGRGGMGIVYEAVQVIKQKRMALKVLPLQALVDSRRMERFFREARITADLKHPNIVPVYDAGQIAGTAYIAMQYIEGKGLDHTLQILREPSGKPSTDDQNLQSSRNSHKTSKASGFAFSDSIIARRRRAGVPILFRDYLKWTVNLGIQAAFGLSYAHKHGLVHRDIKPSNLILGKNGNLWIADFGLARKMEDSTLTSTGVLLGTPRYMSPEQADASIRKVDHRSDIYSLGATLYELVTCRPVFEGKTPQEVLLKILARDPVAPRRLNHLIPAALETIVMKAMSKRPADRYQSAAELADDLQNWVRGKAVMAKRENLLSQSLRWFRENFKFAAVVVSLVLALIILGDLYYREKTRIPTPAPAAGEAPDSGEGNSGETNYIDIPSVLVPVTENTTQNNNGKQVLPDAGETDSSRKAIAEDTRKKQNSVPTPFPTQAKREESVVWRAVPDSPEENGRELNLTWRIPSQSEITMLSGKPAQGLPDAGKNTAPGRTISKDIRRSEKDTVALQKNQRSPAVGAGPFVDQSNLEQPGNKPGWLAMSQTISQTFKPRMPVLTGVDIDLVTANPSMGNDVITVEIRNNNTNQVLARASRAVRVGFTGLLHFDFAHDVPVTVGGTYELYVPGPGANFGWKYTHDTYPDGFSTITNRRGSNPRPDQDCLFQTYGKLLP